jgi:poly-gamma-glutamate capsule biosynthesis protein CapA/YwtB (metallophosphatase superfamily)
MSLAVRLFVCGDVMTGRGIDQILPQPVQPRLYETCVRSAMTYVELAEAASGPIGRGLDARYPWGDALEILDERSPAARLVNLETAVTTSGHAQPGKGIHYRMHPANVACLVQAGVDCCVLANNHVLDWGHSGLLETMETLRSAGMQWAGAGEDAARAAQPAQVALPNGRLLVFAFAAPSSGVPASWAAAPTRAGVNFLESVDERSADRIARAIVAQRRAGDLVVVSVHWGGNWGFAIPREHRVFAHALAQSGAADLVHGHSSHHVQAIEVVHGKLVLYGCGDFINDYEGIGGYEAYGPDFALMYFPVLDAATGDLVELQLVAMRRRRLRLQRANEAERRWLAQTLRREGEPFGTGIRVQADDSFSLTWGRPAPRESD